MKLTKRLSIILLVIALILAGCERQQNRKNQWQDVNLQELMPKGKSAASAKMIAGLSVLFFEMDRAKYPKIETAMMQAGELPMIFADEENFRANGIIAGAGDANTWGKIVDGLADANAAIAKRTTIFLNDGTSEKVEIAAFPQGCSLNYLTKGRTKASMGLPAGAMIFNIGIKSVIGLKQICNISVRPSYQTLTRRIDERKIPAWEYVFESTGFNVNIKAGQFIFLGPLASSKQEVLPSVGWSIFSSQKNAGRIKFCLIVCGLIKD